MSPGISLHSKHASFTISFNIKDINRADLSAIAKRAGHFTITKTEQIPEPENKRSEESEADEGDEKGDDKD